MAKKLESVKLPDLDEAYNKVILWFFSFPDRKMGLNELAESVKISKTTANRTVVKLVKQGFIHSETIGRSWSIWCNKSHIYNYTTKIAYNLSMISNAELLNEVHKIERNPRTVILFGSYRKGDDNEKSDIDIAVEVSKDEDVRIHEAGVIPQFGYRKNVVVNLHFFSRHKIDINLFSNIANGIIIEGFLEVAP